MWWDKKPAPEPSLIEAAPLRELDELRKQVEIYFGASANDVSALSARVEKLEYLLHQRDSMGQGPNTVMRLPFREFKRLKESGLNPKGA